MTPRIGGFLKPLVAALESSDFGVVEQYRAQVAPTPQNEFCLFLKPEVTELPDDQISAVAAVIDEVLEAYGVEISAAVALGGPYISRNRLAQLHYGVINTISRLGLAALSAGAKQELERHFRPDDIDVLGAHQFLDRYPFFTPTALAVFYDNLENLKLGGGAHCVHSIVRGRNTVILNGFHPEQLEFYENPRAKLFVFAMKTSATWHDLRARMTGSTNPQRAETGSIRARLLEDRARLGLKEVSSGRNCVHVSAGPLEAMVEIARYFTDHSRERSLRVHDTTFGRRLAALGLERDHIDFISTNPAMGEGEVSAFDLTEELDSEDAARKLASLLKSIPK